MISSLKKKTDKTTHIRWTDNLGKAGKLLMSSISEIEKSKDTEIINANHLDSRELEKEKYNKIDNIIVGINIIPAPLGVTSLWFPLLDGSATRDIFFRKGINFFNA